MTSTSRSTSAAVAAVLGMASLIGAGRSMSRPYGATRPTSAPKRARKTTPRERMSKANRRKNRR